MLSNLSKVAGGIANPAGAAAGAAISALNTMQLQRIGRSVDEVSEKVDGLVEATKHLTDLATGTMVLSGLTLAVSVAGFAFLSQKLNKIDEKLQLLQKDVKEIKDFLNMQQRAELTTALNTLRDVRDAPSEETRRQLLVHSRQTLGTLHHHYKQQFVQCKNADMIVAHEEYFTVTAIAHALCAGELEMHETAYNDITEAYNCWKIVSQRMFIDHLLRSNPSRFLSKKYAPDVKTDEIIDWLDFAHDEDKGLEWVDELRLHSIDSKNPISFAISLTNDDKFEIELLRKLTARNRIFQSYCAQYEHFFENKIRPSSYQGLIDNLDKAYLVSDTFVLVSDNLLSLPNVLNKSEAVALN